MFDAHQQITDLEAEIEQLQDSVERCRKIDLAGKAVLVGGGLTIGIGFIWQSPVALVLAIGAALGSLALIGSNRRTLHEIVAALKEQEAKRSELIDGMELQGIEHEGTRCTSSVQGAKETGRKGYLSA
jgi:hypothetical protein